MSVDIYGVGTMLYEMLTGGRRSLATIRSWWPVPGCSATRQRCAR